MPSNHIIPSRLWRYHKSKPFKIQYAYFSSSSSSSLFSHACDGVLVCVSQIGEISKKYFSIFENYLTEPLYCVTIFGFFLHLYLIVEQKSINLIMYTINFILQHWRIAFFPLSFYVDFFLSFSSSTFIQGAKKGSWRNIRFGEEFLCDLMALLYNS